jgi:hypothetical protein
MRKIEKKFPSFFKVNQVTLALPSTSCFQESIFSSAGATLTDRRRRLIESPDLLEATTLLRYICAVAAREQQEEKHRDNLSQRMKATTPLSKKLKQDE